MSLSIARIDHVVLHVSEMDRALDFYTNVLGCEVARTVESLGLVQMRAGASMIDLVPGRDPEASTPAARNMDHFCVRVDPWDETAIRDHLAAHGVAVGETRTRVGAEGAGPSIYLTDPDGNVVELKGPAT
ncbi:MULTISPECIES: VOC family protein [unclassified Minwuia]|jgi:glyoxylase I family protein|uniref:VOC family protein n=1 Tax=unclassified Minwuia TaxID=2618799 RepID=UPI00247A2520|nr:MULTISPECIES: VOC family protein [unclassified Minwuia]